MMMNHIMLHFSARWRGIGVLGGIDLKGFGLNIFYDFS